MTLDDHRGQVAHGDFGLIGADVERLALMRTEQGAQIAVYGVGDVAEGAGGQAVGEEDEVEASQGVAEEIGQDAAVGDFEAGAVVVEGTDDFDRDAMDFAEIDAEGFAVAFGFVVATAGAGATDVAAIGFRGGDVGGVGVAVNFAGGKEEEALDGPRHGGIEQMAQAHDVGVHGFDGMLAVKNRGGDGGGVDDEIHRRDGVLSGDVAGLADEVRAAGQFFQPGRSAAGEVVPGDEAAGIAGGW